MDVEDHGRGIHLGTVRRGLGLVAMRERAAIVGGQLEFLRPPKGGTLVRLVMPL
jgi:signal transduction histidine kinase